jgi:predicted amidohydrolase YtcJ
VLVGEFDIQAPAGAVRVDLSGKTVIPAIVNPHGHVGFQKDTSFDKANYSRESIINQLKQYAYYGTPTIYSWWVLRAYPSRPESLLARLTSGCCIARRCMASHAASLRLARACHASPTRMSPSASSFLLG